MRLEDIVHISLAVRKININVIVCVCNFRNTMHEEYSIFVKDTSKMKQRENETRE